MRWDGAVALDIETMPNLAMVDNLPEPKVDSRIKDPDKIMAARAEARRRDVENMALSPFTGRICAYALVSDMHFCRHLESDSDSAEAELVAALLQSINNCYVQGLVLVTFNGLSFDLPYIYARAMVLGITPSVTLQVLSKRYSTIPHCDVRAILTNWDSRANGTLDFFCKTILGESKEELDYSTFGNLIRAGRGAEIAQNCVQHTELTFKLYQRANNVYFAHDNRVIGANSTY